MIVSSCEIHRVISLVHARPFSPMAAVPDRPIMHPFPDPPPDRAPLCPERVALPGQDRRWRDTRILDLRKRLVAGRYAITPDVVADKIIGRALCDQVSRLYDQ
jgi:hypothetical protein